MLEQDPVATLFQRIAADASVDVQRRAFTRIESVSREVVFLERRRRICPLAQDIVRDIKGKQGQVLVGALHPAAD